MDLNTLFSALVSGLGLGSMYGLTALGFFVTFAVSGTVNFAQGSALMLGAVLAFSLQVKAGLPAWVAVPLTLGLCGLWGVLVERLAVRPFARRGSESWLLATVALGLILENLVLFGFGKDPRGMPAGWFTTTGFELAGLRVTAQQLVIPLVGFAIAAALAAFVRRARLGKAMLAVAQNRDAARLMGIDVALAVSAAFAISGVFAGVAGILIAPLFTVSAGMGTLFGLKAYAAAILGGLGNPRGVMAAGVLLGVAEAVVTAAFGSTYTQILTFSLVIATLALRPQGLFGRPAVNKV